MIRYVIAIGDSNSERDKDRIRQVRQRALDLSATWRASIDEADFFAAHEASDSGAGGRAAGVTLLHDHAGVLFGDLFSLRHGQGNHDPQHLREISREDSAAVVESLGRSLVTRYWGYYVAALRHPHTGSGLVLRSPVSPLPCLHFRRGTLHVFFSDLTDFLRLRMTSLSINWDSITAQVVGADYLTHETAINEIETLECGECLECAPAGGIKRIYWHPHEFLKSPRVRSLSCAVEALRHSVDHSVATLASKHASILVTLSGGLDSSIVLSALGRAAHRPTLTAVNYYSRGCGDERPYARDMRNAVDFRLIEYARNEVLDLRCFGNCNLTVRPVLNFSAPDVEERNAALARQFQATAIFDGELGDNVFGRNPGPGVLAECFRDMGVGRRSFAVAMDYAILTRQSIWRVLSSARREMMSLQAGDEFNGLRAMQLRVGADEARSQRLVSDDALASYMSWGERFLHPWLRNARKLAPGADRLLTGLATVTSPAYHSPFSKPGDPPQVSPLITQPLMELALCIPRYWHFGRARERAVARTAFADVLPAKVLRRSGGKGGPTLWAEDVVDHNVEFLREFLLHGSLVRRGLIDRTRLEVALSPTIARSSAAVGDILAKLYMEAWIAKFDGSRGCAI